ncbi:MAG: efflux transporter outer membrane subunit [Deltaproteobacteria bacterium]|nr:efflux transporter outer membrane subunit [Deltaproteobacteria bacterium]
MREKMTLMRWERLLFAVGLLVSVTSCTVGPEYVRPITGIPVSYKEIDGWKVASPNDDAIKEAWWELFNDPQMNALEAQVIVANPNVWVAEAQFRQARALVQSARAGYFPTLTVGASAKRAASSENLGPSTSGVSVSDFLLPIDLSWEADLWGRIRRTVEASQASAQASAADLAAVRLSAQAELALDYLQLRTLDAQKQLLDSTVAYYGKSLELTNNRYNSGVVARSDVLQAETQLKSTRAQALDLGLQRAQMEHAMAILIGKPASEFSLPAAPLIPSQPSIPVSVPSELLEQRSDIAAAERRMAMANAQIGVARAAFYPTVQIGALAGLEASRADQWLSWPSRFWSVGPSISQTVFDGGLRQAQSDQALAAYDATAATYRKIVLNAFQEVEDNLAALRILGEEARVQTEAVNAARQAAAVTINQYKAGTVSYINVIVAQTAKLASERTLLEIRSRQLAASVLLIKALGGGWKSADLPSVNSLN